MVTSGYATSKFFLSNQRSGQRVRRPQGEAAARLERAAAARERTRRQAESVGRSPAAPEERRRPVQKRGPKHSQRNLETHQGTGFVPTVLPPHPEQSVFETDVKVSAFNRVSDLSFLKFCGCPTNLCRFLASCYTFTRLPSETSLPAKSPNNAKFICSNFEKDT